MQRKKLLKRFTRLFPEQVMYLITSYIQLKLSILKSFEDLNMKNYRRRLDIIADILQVVSQNAKKTQIMFQANLSYKVLQRYMEDITSASLISFETTEQCYVLTQKGQEFLEAYKEYAKTNKRIEKHLNDVGTKKKNLEELCSTE
jgi:predicted transcriptional regulator